MDSILIGTKKGIEIITCLKTMLVTFLAFAFQFFNQELVATLKDCFVRFCWLHMWWNSGSTLEFWEAFSKLQTPIQVELELGYMELQQHGFCAAAHFGNKTHGNQTFFFFLIVEINAVLGWIVSPLKICSRTPGICVYDLNLEMGSL